MATRTIFDKLANHERIIIKSFRIILTLRLTAIVVGSIIDNDCSGALGILVVDSGVLVLFYIALKTTPRAQK